MAEVNFGTSHGKTVSTTHSMNGLALGAFYIARESHKGLVLSIKICLREINVDLPPQYVLDVL